MIPAIRTKIEQLKGKRQALIGEQEKYTNQKDNADREQSRWEKAREVITEVGLKTQKQLQYHISNLTTMALEAVFDDPYTVEIEFVPRRKGTECDIWFVRNNRRIDPMSDAGLGAADVAAFALRVAAWSMKRPRSRNLFILDEPFKHLKGKKENLRAILMMKEISEKLNLQIITVSDERAAIEDIEEGADKVFKINIQSGESVIMNTI